ncbi:MAG: ankyrin repeat domain-containing protein, partial [Halioglobus sp.]
MQRSLLTVFALCFALLLVAPSTIAQSTSGSGSRAASNGVVGDTELHWAAYRGHTDFVERLLRSGAAVNKRVEKGSTPLHLAAYKGHAQVV